MGFAPTARKRPSTSPEGFGLGLFGTEKEEFRKGKRYHRTSYLALAWIIVGFVLQIASNWLLRRIPWTKGPWATLRHKKRGTPPVLRSALTCPSGPSQHLQRHPRKRNPCGSPSRPEGFQSPALPVAAQARRAERCRCRRDDIRSPPAGVGVAGHSQGRLANPQQACDALRPSLQWGGCLMWNRPGFRHNLSSRCRKSRCSTGSVR